MAFYMDDIDFAARFAELDRRIKALEVLADRVSKLSDDFACYGGKPVWDLLREHEARLDGIHIVKLEDQVRGLRRDLDELKLGHTAQPAHVTPPAVLSVRVELGAGEPRPKD